MSDKTSVQPKKEKRDIIRAAEKEALRQKHARLLEWWSSLPEDEKSDLITGALDSLPPDQRRFYEQMNREGLAFIDFVYSFAFPSP